MRRGYDRNRPARWTIWAALAVAVAGTATFGAPADATEVVVPKSKPRVAMEVPDGWSVEETDIGVELRSPEKDSVVFATMLKRDMTSVDAWKAKVLDKMGSDGITVDKAAKTAAAKAAANKASTDKASADKAPDTSASAKTAPTDQLPGTAAMPSFAVAGAPSVSTPSLADPGADLASSDDAIPSLVAPTPAGHAEKSTINGLHFQSYRLEGGMFKDKPTDIQLVLYLLPKGEFFAVEQQSGSEDNRAAGILNTVKQVHP